MPSIVPRHDTVCDKKLGGSGNKVRTNACKVTPSGMVGATVPGSLYTYAVNTSCSN